MTFDTARGPCTVHVGPGAIAHLAHLVPPLRAAGRVFVVADANVSEDHAARAIDGLIAAGIAVDRTTIVATEAAKSLDTVAFLYDAFAEARVERRTPVVAIGGGITGDVAGYAAATWLRGVPVVQVPTTLLAMVDASIGGKTGVNLPLPGGGLGKNMVGAFWPPSHIVADPLTLATLDDRTFRSGFGECIKHGLIASPALLEMIEADATALLDRQPDACSRLVARAARIKIDVVVQDEREAGIRAHLNLGHTFAHAVEAIAGGKLTHGEAVAIGLVAAADVAAHLGRIGLDDVDALRRRLEVLGLPASLPAPAADWPVDRLCGLMLHDKKVDAGAVRLVVAGPAGTCTIEAADPAMVQRAWAAVGAGA